MRVAEMGTRRHGELGTALDKRSCIQNKKMRGWLEWESFNSQDLDCEKVSIFPLIYAMRKKEAKETPQASSFKHNRVYN